MPAEDEMLEASACCLDQQCCPSYWSPSSDPLRCCAWLHLCSGQPKGMRQLECHSDEYGQQGPMGEQQQQQQQQQPLKVEDQ